MYDFVNDYIVDDRKSTIDVKSEQQPPMPTISTKQWFQLQRSLEIIGIAMKDLTEQEKLKHSLVLIRHELMTINAISRKFHLNFFDDSKIGLIVTINWHLSDLKIFNEHDISNFRVHFNSLKNIVNKQGEDFN